MLNNLRTARPFVPTCHSEEVPATEGGILAFKRQADIDLDRRWSLRPWPPATAETPTPQHDIGDHEAVQSDSTGHNHNDAWEISASSCSAAQKGADSSYTAEFAGSWKANEARELSSLAETSALLSSCEERHFPVNEIQNSIDESSWPSDSASVLNFSMLHHHGQNLMDEITVVHMFSCSPLHKVKTVKSLTTYYGRHLSSMHPWIETFPLIKTSA